LLCLGVLHVSCWISTFFIALSPSKSLLALAAEDNGWWDDGEHDEWVDPLEQVFYTHPPKFIETSHKEIMEGDERAILFELKTMMPVSDEHPVAQVKEAFAHVTADGGKHWAHERLSSECRESAPEWKADDGATVINRRANCQERENSNVAVWRGKTQLRSIHSDGSPIVYIFSAVDTRGNVAMELPITSPSWPPDVKHFFPLTQDEEIKDYYFEPSLDLIDSYIARDERNIYFVVGVRDNIKVGNMNSSKMNYYVPRLICPEITTKKDRSLHDMLGESILFYKGSHFIYSPSHYFPFPPMDMKMALEGNADWAKRIVDSCPNIAQWEGFDGMIGINDNRLFMKSNMKCLCENDVDEVVVSLYTMQMASTDSISPILFDISPYARIYFRSNTIDSVGHPVRLEGFGYEKLSPPKLIPDSVYASEFKPVGLSVNEAFEKAQKGYVNWLEALGEESGLEHRIGKIYNGAGPFLVKPCDIVFHESFRFEIYTRPKKDKISSLKARIYDNNKLVHTIMIGPDTKPLRDEAHDTRIGRITLENLVPDFNGDLSCDFVIKKLPIKK